MKDQNNNFSISPKYNVDCWKKARDELDWIQMTIIFNDRLEGRFLKPIRLIESDQRISNFSGFSILALDCLIIETLQQFYDDTDESESVGNAFTNFLTNSEFFKTFFN